VKPGILGWARINIRPTGPGEPDPALALEYDLYYIKHLSPAIDFYILLHSVAD
jgi:lipopolysaccharide/colanic/teichoic acid biosynthesis glycosyltransferase